MMHIANIYQESSFLLLRRKMIGPKIGPPLFPLATVAAAWEAEETTYGQM